MEVRRGIAHFVPLNQQQLAYLYAMQLIVIGGGAAGFFGAIAAAAANPAARVLILERGNAVLQKVKVSGGGRCNATHACFDARALVQYYPRGSRELLGPFMRFGPAETVAWFAERGVRLKTEADGRMFPVTDDSQTIVDCLQNAARRAGVQVRSGARVEGLEQTKSGWLLRLPRQETLHADQVLVASGSSEAVWDLLRNLGHTIVPPVPSLFTFNVKDPRLKELAGVSVPDAAVQVNGAAKLSARGPLLITHWGLSGPAILRLSAWGARDLHALEYKFLLSVNWLGDMPAAEIMQMFNRVKQENGRKQIAANALFGLPQRLWERLVAAAGIAPESVGPMRARRACSRSALKSAGAFTGYRAKAPSKKSSLPPAAWTFARSISRPLKASCSPDSILPEKSLTSTPSPAASTSRQPGRAGGSRGRR